MRVLSGSPLLRTPPKTPPHGAPTVCSVGVALLSRYWLAGSISPHPQGGREILPLIALRSPILHRDPLFAEPRSSCWNLLAPDTFRCREDGAGMRGMRTGSSAYPRLASGWTPREVESPGVRVVARSRGGPALQRDTASPLTPTAPSLAGSPRPARKLPI